MEEKEVKNEVPAPETEKGKESEKQEKGKKELTPQQIQQRKKMLVYPLMGLVFLGAMFDSRRISMSSAKGSVIIGKSPYF